MQPDSAATNPPGQLGAREFVALLAMLMALQALGVDSMLPALDRIAHDLHVASANQRQLVIGVFLISAGLTALVPGPLADRYGRRPVVLGALGGYVALSLVCALAPTFPLLLAGRIGMGLFGSALSVLPTAIIRDRFEGDRMARTQSLVGMVFMVVPMVAPTLGQAVLLFAGWRWIFGIQALAGLAVALWVALRLPETLRPEFRQRINARAVVSTLQRVLTCRPAIGYVLGMALVQGTLLGYINCSEQLVAEHFGAGAHFPLVFGGMALCMASTNFINARIVERFGARRVSHSAVLCYIAISLIHLLIARSGHETLVLFVPLMACNMCLITFLGSNFSSIALQPFLETAGAASGAQMFVRMTLGSVLGAVIGGAFDGTAAPLALSMVLAGGGALALVMFSEEGQLFRRVYPRGAARPVI